MLNAANPLARVFKADYNWNQERETILGRVDDVCRFFGNRKWRPDFCSSRRDDNPSSHLHFRDLLILFLAATLLQPPPILSSLARYLALGKSVVKRY